VTHFHRIAVVIFLTVFAGSALADLRQAGSSVIQPIARDAAEHLKQQDAGSAIDVQGGGSDAGIRALLAGKADIAMVSRLLTPEEAGKLSAVLIGLDGIALAVNERNPVAGLTHAQVHSLFAGQVSDWREIEKSAFTGITIPVIRSPGRAARQIFDQHFRIGMLLPTHVVELGTNLAALLYLSSDPQAVGYLSIGALEEGRRRGLKVKGVALDGIDPSIQACIDGRYLLGRPGPAADLSARLNDEKTA